MKPTSFVPAPLQCLKQSSSLHQLLLALAFGLLLLTLTAPFNQLNPLHGLLSPSSSPAHDHATEVRTDGRRRRSCDYSRGEWVRDASPPAYTNETCRGLIQERENCMLHERPDSGYLRWRWRPSGGCDLPRFDPVRFLELVRGKSMAFVGDSLARNQMQSLMCLLSGVVATPVDVSTTDNDDYRRMHYQSHNFTLIVHWSPFLVRPTLDASDGIRHLYLDEVDSLWVDAVRDFDYVIISDGNWFVKPALLYQGGQLVGCHACELPGVADLGMRHSNRIAFRTALRALLRQQVEGYRGVTVVRTMSPDHFENGDWDTGGDCPRTEPYVRGEVRMAELEKELYRAQVEEFWAAEGEARRKGLEFRLLDTTAAMLLRPDGHPSRYGHWPNTTNRNDCVHWCLPGPVDMWNDVLLQILETTAGRQRLVTSTTDNNP